MQKLSFSGHEKFECRTNWLKKGFDFFNNGKNSKDPHAVVDLGVGKNMVLSIKYWMRSFNLLDKNDRCTDFATYIFGEDGKDPYLEDQGTIWLLHYKLVTTEVSSINSIVFNHFRKQRFEFSKNQLLRFIKSECVNSNSQYNENTVLNDINVFIKNYYRSRTNINVEDDCNAILSDLELLKELDILDFDRDTLFRIESEERIDLPYEIILFAILDKHKDEVSISFNELLTGDNNVGKVFVLTSGGLYNKLNQISNSFRKEILFTDDAGIKELQFKVVLNKWNILDNYYVR